MNIEAKNLSKIYGDGENRVVALDHANLEIVSSDFISIMGPSISTLLISVKSLYNQTLYADCSRYRFLSLFCMDRLFSNNKHPC